MECKHYFSNLKDDGKIDNVKCDNCDMTYYQFLLKEISFWNKETKKSKQESQQLRDNLEQEQDAHQYSINALKLALSDLENGSYADGVAMDIRQYLKDMSDRKIDKLEG